MCISRKHHHTNLEQPTLSQIFLYKGIKFLIFLAMRVFYHGGDQHKNQNKYAWEKAFYSHTIVFDVCVLQILFCTHFLMLFHRTKLHIFKHNQALFKQSATFSRSYNRLFIAATSHIPSVFSAQINRSKELIQSKNKL